MTLASEWTMIWKKVEGFGKSDFNIFQQKCLKEQGQDWRRLCLRCRRLISPTHVASSYFIVIAVVKSCTTHSSMETGDRWNSSWCMWLSNLANCKPILPKVAPSPALVEGDKAGDAPGANVLHICFNTLHYLHLSVFTFFFGASSERKSRSKCICSTYNTVTR